MSGTSLPTPSFSIITVNFNNSNLLINVLERTLAALEGFRFEVIVVDNGSTDDSLKNLANHFQGSSIVRVKDSGRNGGFGFGCNVGANAAKTPILWFLNSDAWVASTEGLLQSLELTTQKSTGIVGTSVLLNDSSATPQGGGDMSFGFFVMSSFRIGAVFRRIPRPIQERCLSLLARMRGGFGRYARSFSHHLSDEAFASPSVGGASFLIRATLYRDLNGFDEGFFLYDEDIDLCIRCLGRKLQNWITPRVVVKTFPSATTSKLPSLRLKKIKRLSRTRLIRKHFYGLQKTTLLLVTSLTWLLL